VVGLAPGVPPTFAGRAQPRPRAQSRPPAPERHPPRARPADQPGGGRGARTWTGRPRADDSGPRSRPGRRAAVLAGRGPGLSSLRHPTGRARPGARRRAGPARGWGARPSAAAAPTSRTGAGPDPLAGAVASTLPPLRIPRHRRRSALGPARAGPGGERLAPGAHRARATARGDDGRALGRHHGTGWPPALGNTVASRRGEQGAAPAPRRRRDHRAAGGPPSCSRAGPPRRRSRAGRGRGRGGRRAAGPSLRPRCRR
jgi:hypothetical protein